MLTSNLTFYYVNFGTWLSSMIWSSVDLAASVIVSLVHSMMSVQRLHCRPRLLFPGVHPWINSFSRLSCHVSIITQFQWLHATQQLSFDVQLSKNPFICLVLCPWDSQEPSITPHLKGIDVTTTTTKHNKSGPNVATVDAPECSMDFS